jgi:hypothetical protein
MLLSNEQIINQLKTPRVVSMIIYCEGLYYKMYCEGSIGKDIKPMFRIFGICEDPKVQVFKEEVLNYFEINSIFKLLQVKGVLHPTLPLKNIRSF